MKVYTLGLGLALLSSISYTHTQQEIITIKSSQGNELTVPRSVLNTPLLLAWFKQNNVQIPDMKGLISAQIEQQLIDQETQRQEAIALKEKQRQEAIDYKKATIAHYLATGQGRETIDQYGDISFSLNDLLENGILKAIPAHRKMQFGKNIIRIHTLSMNNQLINCIKGLESINDINRFGYIDLSDNRIKSLDLQTLKSIHSQLQFSITLNLANNPFRITKELRNGLARLPMITISQ